MKIILEVKDFKEEEYDFYDEKKSLRVQGIKRTVSVDGGFSFKFKSPEDMNKIKDSAEGEINCSVDKYGRISMKE